MPENDFEASKSLFTSSKLHFARGWCGFANQQDLPPAPAFPRASEARMPALEYACRGCKVAFKTPGACRMHQVRSPACQGAGSAITEHQQPQKRVSGSRSDLDGSDSSSESGSDGSEAAAKLCPKQPCDERSESCLKLSDVFTTTAAQDSIAFIVDEGLHKRQANRLLAIVNEASQQSDQPHGTGHDLTLSQLLKKLDNAGSELGLPPFKTTDLKIEDDEKDFPGKICLIHRDAMSLVQEKFKQPKPRTAFTMSAAPQGGETHFFDSEILIALYKNDFVG